MTATIGVSSVTVVAVNDAPVIDLDATTAGLDFATTYTEGSPATLIEDPTAVVNDLDNTQLDAISVTITDRLDGKDEVLSATASGSVSVSFDAATGVLTLAGPADVSDFQDVLRTVTYLHTSDAPTTGDRHIQFIVDDGTDNSAAATTTVTVSGTNDPPEGDLDPTDGPASTDHAHIH